MHLSLFQKIGLSLAILITLMLSIALIAKERVSVIDQNLTEVSQGAQLKQRYAINFRGSVHDRAISIRDAVLVDNDSALEKHLEEIRVLAEFYAKSADPMKQALAQPGTTTDEINLQKKIDEIEVITLELSEKVIAVRLSGDRETARQILLNEVAGAYSEWLKRINAFIDYQESIIKDKAGKAQDVANQFATLVVVIAFVALIVGILLSIGLIRSTRRTLGEDPEKIKEYMLRLSEGELTLELPENRPKNSVLDAISVTQSKFLSAIDEVNSVLTSMAKGDLDKRVNADLKGDMAQLKTGVNDSIGAVNLTIDALDSTVNALKNGDFSHQLNAHVEGRFLNIISNAQSSMDTMNETIEGIIIVMDRMKEGKFQYRVEVEARGDLHTLKQGVNDSMDALERAMNDITDVVVAQSEGDLTKTITREYHGELNTLKEAVNASASKLNDTVAEILAVSDSVEEASGQVSEGSNDLSQRTQQQAAMLEETAASMEEMTATVQQNTEAAQQASQLSTQARASADHGSTVAEQAIQAMSDITESSNKISDIITLIDGIAFQTNLLALNAAVEAARAGDHGRGFAVVAGEVRTLAQRSAEASNEIKGLIENSVTTVEQGAKFVSQTGDALKEINQSIRKVNDIVADIASASSEQATGIGQVNTSVSSMDEVTQQNAALVEETTSASGALNQQASYLKQLMGFFKTYNVKGQAGKSGSVSKPAKAVNAPNAKAKPSEPTAEKKSTGANQSGDWAEF